MAAAMQNRAITCRPGNCCYSERVKNDRAYSARRNSITSVMRERATPRVIEPAMSAMATIDASIGSLRRFHHGPTSRDRAPARQAAGMPLATERESLQRVMRRRFSYALTAGVLSSGAPAGLLGVRLAKSHADNMSLQEVGTELRSDRLAYLYIGGATAFIFAMFGYLLGRKADRLAQLSETDPLTDLLNARGLS